MIEIEITNYESIEHTKLVVEGLTTVTGRNYLGKSSILRAVNAALTNKEGTEFISWGKTFCEVHIKTQDIDILWHKEDGNSYYKVNGKEYTKIGRGDPPKEIFDAGFKPITIGDQKINLNYAVQFHPLFLVDKRDSKSADILTSVYGLDRIYKAIDLCNKEQRYNSDLLKIREKDLKQTEDSLVKFKTFPDIVSIIPSLKKVKKEIDGKEKEIEKSRQWNENLRVLAGDNRRLKPIIDIEIPSADAITKDISEYQKVVGYKEGALALNSIVKRLQPISNIIVSEEPINEIKDLFSNYQKVLVQSSQYRKLSEEVDRLSKITEVILPECNINMEDIPKLQELIAKAKSVGSDVRNLGGAIEAIAIEISEVTKEIDSFDICPLCGANRE